MKPTILPLLSLLLLLLFSPITLAQPSTRPATRITITPAGGSASSSGVEVTISSAKLEYLILKKHNPDNTTEDMVSNQNLLVIRLQIKNNGKKEITYQSFNGAPG